MGSAAIQRGGEGSGSPIPCRPSVTALPLRLPTMGSVGSERFKELSPAGTPEGNVVMSFSFDSYQLEEDELQRGSQAKGVLTFMEPGEGRHSQEMGSLLLSHPFRSFLGWAE